jgi:hypothetical protein
MVFRSMLMWNCQCGIANEESDADAATKRAGNLRICRSVACRVLSNGLLLLVLVTVSPRAWNRLGWEFVVHHEAGLDDSRLWGGKLGARSAWSIVEAGRRCKT